MFRVFSILLSFFLFCNQIVAQNNALVVSGLDKLQKRNYKEALSDFKSALKTEPSNIQALCGSALAQDGLNNSDEALLIAESALNLDSKSDIANYTKGEILLSKKNYVSAIASFNKALEINKRHVASIIGKSKAFNLLDDVKEAYKILDNAILEIPNNYELYLARGILNNNKEKYSKALNDFDMAINSNIGQAGSNNFSVYLNRGIAYSSLEEYDSALEDLTKACELDPSNANAQYSCGLANYQVGNYDASVKNFIRADELNPNNSVTYYNLGMSYYKLDDLSNACKYFHKACGMKNTNACKMVIMTCTDSEAK